MLLIQCESPERCPTHLVIIGGYLFEVKCKQMVRMISMLEFFRFWFSVLYLFFQGNIYILLK